MQLLIEKDTNIVKFWIDDQFQFYFRKDKIICTRDKKIETNDYTLFTESMYKNYFTDEYSNEENNLDEQKKKKLDSFVITHFKDLNTNKLVAVNTNNIEVIKNAPTSLPKFIKTMGWNNLKFIDGKYEILFDPAVNKLKSGIKDFKEEIITSTELNFELNFNENAYVCKDLQKESAEYLKNNKSSVPTIKKIAKHLEMSTKEFAEFIYNYANELKNNCVNVEKEIEQFELKIKDKIKNIEYFNEHQVEPEI